MHLKMAEFIADMLFRLRMGACLLSLVFERNRRNMYMYDTPVVSVFFLLCHATWLYLYEILKAQRFGSRYV